MERVNLQIDLVLTGRWMGDTTIQPDVGTWVDAGDVQLVCVSFLGKSFFSFDSVMDLNLIAKRMDADWFVICKQLVSRRDNQERFSRHSYSGRTVIFDGKIVSTFIEMQDFQ